MKKKAKSKSKCKCNCNNKKCESKESVGIEKENQRAIDYLNDLGSVEFREMSPTTLDKIKAWFYGIFIGD